MEDETDPVEAAPAPAPPAERTPQQQLADAYDIDDDPPIELPPQPAPQAAESQRQLPPRGEDGRFLKPEPEQPATPKHSPHTERMAREFGISDETISAISPDALQEIVWAKAKEYREIVRQHGIASTVEQALHPAPVPGAPDAAAQVQAPGQGEEAFDESRLDPAFSRWLNAKLAPIQKQLSHLLNQQVRQETQSAIERFDSHVVGKHSEVLGKGRGHELPADSPEFHRRKAVIDLMAKDKSNAPLEAKIDKAVAILYPTAKHTPKTEPTLSAEEQQWLNSGLRRPTNRITTEAPGRSKAIRSVAEKMNEINGALADAGTGDATLEDFPG